MAYLKAQRILYSGNKNELARQTGMNRRTISNRQKHPEKTTAAELAAIAKAKGLSISEVIEVLEDFV